MSQALGKYSKNQTLEPKREPLQSSDAIEVAKEEIGTSPSYGPTQAGFI